MRVGLLGGTFDPPHRGHLRMAALAQRALALDRVLFLPCARQPLKGTPPEASPFHRAAMVALAIAGHESWMLCDLELARGATTYTVETLEALRELDPKAEFHLILGSDSFASFSLWRRYRDIPGLASLVVVPRDGGRPGSAPRGVPEDRVRWLAVAPKAISSTEARAKLRQGLPAARMLPSAVERYARRQGLYEFRQSAGRRRVG